MKTMKPTIDISGQDNYGPVTLRKDLQKLHRSVIALVRTSRDDIAKDEAIKYLDVIEWLIYDVEIVHDTLTE